MKNRLIAIVAVLIAAAAATYFYLNHQFEQKIRDLIAAYNSDIGNEVIVSVESISTNLFAKSAELGGVILQERESDNTTATVKSLSLNIDTLGASSFAIRRAALDDLKIAGADANLQVGSVTIEGADLAGAMNTFASGEFAGPLLQMMEVNNIRFHVSGADNDDGDFGLETYRVVLSEDGRGIKELVAKGFSGELPKAKVTMKLDSVTMTGGEFGAFFDAFKEMQAATNDAEPKSEEAIEAAVKLARAMMRESLNYMGIDSFSLVGFELKVPTGTSVSLKRAQVSDIERREGVIVGVRSVIEDLIIDNLQNTSPQARQMLALVDFNTLRMNMQSVSHFDAASKSTKGTSLVVFDNLFALRSDATIHDMDPALMVEKLVNLQEEQIRNAMAMQEPEPDATPEDIAAFQKQTFDNMLAMYKKAYTGFYSGLDLAIDLEDRGLVEKGSTLYGVMSGMTPEQARQMLVAALTAELQQSLQEGAPANLAGVLQDYVNVPSVPFRLSVRNLAPLTEEALNTMDANNWQTLIGLELQQLPDGVDDTAL
ncbi:MAG: hypothetical protein EP335_10885 [Alphaproteobacteria bacterium]|nr:MAG: hypothetical protein EP335_10885 [Alphaproteobacteria bacterium]